VPTMKRHDRDGTEKKKHGNDVGLPVQFSYRPTAYGGFA